MPTPGSIVPPDRPHDPAPCLARPGGTVHLVGIGGVGMAGLALHLKARGFTVRGSDARETRITAWLRAHGVTVHPGHRVAHLAPETRWMIKTPAVGDDNPEVTAARQRGLPVFSRGEVLPVLLRDGYSVAVCGTHGKTTTSALLVHLLRRAGRDPSFLVGGEIDDAGAVAGVGAGGITVAEADESDGTLALYAPDVTVLTGIEFDHMENFPDEAAFAACFRSVVRRTRQALVYCADDPGARRAAADVPGALSYGLAAAAAVRAVSVQLAARQVAFELALRGTAAGPVRMPAPGRHNVENALAALAAGTVLGLDMDAMRDALADFRPVRRRFEWIRDDEELAVVTDYAHHPSEIKAAVAAARGMGRSRLVVLFQPHRYTRTRALGAAFPAAFEGVDRLVLAPVYAASEAPIPGGSSQDLLQHFRAQGAARVELAKDLPDACDIIWSILRRGDMLLIVGAGDVDRVAALTADWSGRAERRSNERDARTGTEQEQGK